MNRSILIPRRNPVVLSRLARFICKLRYYRYLGLEFVHAIPMAWRTSRKTN